MKRFLATYMGSMESFQNSNWDKLTPEKRKELEGAGMAAWGQWVEEHKKSIIEIGGPIGKTKLTNAAGVSDMKNRITGFTVVQAENHEAAAKMFLNHPHFKIFPGESVEIMEILEIPKRPS